MSEGDVDFDEIAKWDPGFIEGFYKLISPVIRRYFRTEVRGLESIPTSGGALLVSNHSGGNITPDPLVMMPEFYRHFGYDRPLYILAHYGVFYTPFRDYLKKLGTIHASRPNAHEVLNSGAVVLVFPGGDYDAYRSTFAQNVIDFEGRVGYVRTAIETGVPIVPAVSIGGQETQLFVARNGWLAKRLGLHRIRMDILPLTVGIPFGMSMIFPANIPLPSKIVYQVLEPIHITEQFGTDPDVHEVDTHVRSVMQSALDELARQRRFPVMG